jgi:hypothetical protein
MIEKLIIKYPSGRGLGRSLGGREWPRKGEPIGEN